MINNPMCNFLWRINEFIKHLPQIKASKPAF